MDKYSTSITPRLVRQLLLARLLEVGSPRHVSAASGMVMVGECLYVVSDDDLQLAVFDAHGHGEGKLLRLFPGNLPADPSARKAAKPDLEVLMSLPSCNDYPSGALLALGSGSRPNRRAGVILDLDPAGGIMGMPKQIDLSGLYRSLESRFPALNIEGGLVRGEELILLQRGSGKQPENALISFPLAQACESMRTHGDAPMISPTSIQIVALGLIDGTPLSFTDAIALADGRILFSAVAERSPDNYQDGACVGAAVGVVGRDGHVQQLHRLHPYLQGGRPAGSQ